MSTLISEHKQNKLIKKFPAFLKSKKKALMKWYGQEKTDEILNIATKEFPAIVQQLPTFKSSMYDTLMSTGSKLAALKKGMNACGISTEEFVRFNIETTRDAAAKVPGFARKLGGKIYLSGFMRKYLKKVARTISANGWPTEVINGSKKDDFAMSVETRNCQMVAFWEQIGEGDIKPYCTFFDFTAAEALGVGLKQVSTIDSGVCKYCFYKKGSVQWPKEISHILN